MTAPHATRAEAKQAGALRYNTGKPCKHGHVSDRRTSDAKCIECSVEREKVRPPRNSSQDVAARSAYREKNKERIREAKRQHYLANRDRINSERRARTAATRLESGRPALTEEQRRESKAAYFRRHYKENRDKILSRKQKYHAKNPDVADRNRGKRRARQRQALPGWYGELDAFVWAEAADLVRRRERCTGIKWDADHIIPVAGKKARGLHVWSNCQVIPKQLNLLKGNRMLFTQPGEWTLHLSGQISPA